MGKKRHHKPHHPHHPRRNTLEGRDIRRRVRTLKRTIGFNIEYIRKRQDMPLRALSNRTGFTAVKLDYWEMGRMEIPFVAIVRIAKALKVPVERLFELPDQGGVTCHSR